MMVDTVQENIKKLEDLPSGTWGLDNRWLAYSEAAMHARWLMRNVIAAEAGVDPATVEKVFSPHTSTQLYMAYSRQTDDDTVLRTQAAFEHLQAEGEVARIMAGQP